MCWRGAPAGGGGGDSAAPMRWMLTQRRLGRSREGRWGTGPAGSGEGNCCLPQRPLMAMSLRKSGCVCLRGAQFVSESCRAAWAKTAFGVYLLTAQGLASGIARQPLTASTSLQEVPLAPTDLAQLTRGAASLLLQNRCLSLRHRHCGRTQIRHRCQHGCECTESCGQSAAICLATSPGCTT